MKTHGIKTSHDLADALEGAARALRMVPPFELSGFRQNPQTGGVVDGPLKQDHGKHSQDSLVILAQELPDLSRSEAEYRISSLTVESIRQLAQVLDIRMPSKATKHVYIELLLTQLFDVPVGQELIRTFHKRSGPPASESLMRSAVVQPLPRDTGLGKR